MSSKFIILDIVMKNTPAGAWKALRKASRSTLQDLLNLSTGLCKLVVAFVAVLPLDLIISLILVILAVCERQIILGGFDAWLK